MTINPKSSPRNIPSRIVVGSVFRSIMIWLLVIGPKHMLSRLSRYPVAMTGDEIKAEREARGLTQAQLAALAEVSRKSIVEWEAEVSAPRRTSLAKLQAVFDSLSGSPPMTVAEFVALRTRNGWTPRAVAHYLGVPILRVYHWRSGRLVIPAAMRSALRAADGNPSVELAHAIATTAATARARGLDQIAADLEAIADRL
jgi:DNA-binding transcriptional regulator YiaG